jgi:hypothetical protein
VSGYAICSGRNGCGASWTGHRIEHCTVCHQTFTGTRPGDMHRAWKAKGISDRCLTVDEMLAKGMTRNRFGHWTTGEQMSRTALRARRQGAEQVGG